MRAECACEACAPNVREAGDADVMPKWRLVLRADSGSRLKVPAALTTLLWSAMVSDHRPPCRRDALVQITVTSAEREAWRCAAGAAGQQLSEFVRSIVRSHLERIRDRVEPLPPEVT